MTNHFERLPPELIEDILTRLNITALCALRLSGDKRIADLIARNGEYQEEFSHVHFKLDEEDLADHVVVQRLHPALAKQLEGILLWVGQSTWHEPDAWRLLHNVLELVFSTCGGPFEFAITPDYNFMRNKAPPSDIAVDIWTEAGRADILDDEEASAMVPCADMGWIFYDAFSYLVDTGHVRAISTTVNQYVPIATFTSIIATNYPRENISQNLRWLKKLRIDLHSSRGDGDMTILDSVVASHRYIHHFARVLSTVDLEELYLSWNWHPDYSPARAHDALTIVTNEVEAFFFIRVANTVALPGLRKLCLSGGSHQTIWLTQEAMSTFFSHSPLLDSIVLEDICLRGRWDPLFLQWQTLPNLDSLYLEALGYWNRSTGSSWEELSRLIFTSESRGYFLERNGSETRQPIEYESQGQPMHRSYAYLEDIIQFVEQELDPERLQSVLDGISNNVLILPQFNPHDPSNARSAPQSDDNRSA